MIAFHDTTITVHKTKHYEVDKKGEYKRDKNNELIDLKKPITIPEILVKDKCIHGLEEFYEVLTAFNKLEPYEKLEVNFNLSFEY